MISLKLCENQEKWDDFVHEYDGHPLQLWGWGEVKAAHGWQVLRLTAHNLEGELIGGAQVLIKRLPWPFKALAYIPRGPVGESSDAPDVLDAMANYVRTNTGAVALKIEPDWEDLPENLGSAWQPSQATILIPRTLILDLNHSEDELLSVMAKKTRQYIRKSSNEEGLVIRQLKGGEELNAVLDIYHLTADRAGFALHGDDYYRDIYNKMGEASPVFAAFHDGEPVAFLWLAISAGTAFELYGGMNDAGQGLRANYALKWHVISKMREWGIERYDMNGLLNDGVSTFKQSFADHEDMLVGTYDRPLSPLYTIWTKALPFGKKLVRAVKRS